ncbi:MAG: NAD(P)H-hydrate dehydratase [Treponema sp.]|nr:NAD(P)H-hydrate dehydratase [Treponema sp.]
MINLFFDTRKLDALARENYELSEEIMMENAAGALESEVMTHAFSQSGTYMHRPTVLILAGKGNNGADGYALARRLICHEIAVFVFESGEPESDMGKLQKNRAQKIGVHFISLYELDSFLEEKSFDLTVIVDCLYGAGFHLPLDAETEAVLSSVNKNDAYKIACDIPTGIDCHGNASPNAFRADSTVTMGAHKVCLYSDFARDLCGKISCTNLGISKTNFENPFILPDAYLLEQNDIQLPSRRRLNVNKGSFGHLAVLKGKMDGAATICAKAAFSFGAGLVSLVGENFLSGEYEIIKTSSIPEKATALALGMGLGNPDTDFEKQLIDSALNFNGPVVCDADMFHNSKICQLLKKNKELVLTPHPKEFADLLNLTMDYDNKISVHDAIENKLNYMKDFCTKYKDAVLLVKGAVPVISKWNSEESRVKSYFNPHGTNALAKGGSGDVLAGLIGSLLAQGYNTLSATVSASLAHSLASQKSESSFSLTPLKLIEYVEYLEK